MMVKVKSFNKLSINDFIEKQPVNQCHIFYIINDLKGIKNSTLVIANFVKQQNTNTNYRIKA